MIRCTRAILVHALWLLLALPFGASLAAPADSADDGADDAPTPTWSFEGTLGAYSDYVWRGVTQTDGKPAAQLDVALTHSSGFFAGMWLSNVDFGEDDGVNIEVDPYIGWSGELAENGTELEITLTRVSFPGTKSGYDYDYTELEGKLSLPQHFYVGLAYSPDIFHLGAHGIYYNVGGEWPLGESGFAVKAQAGHYDLEKAAGDSYNDYLLGVSREFGPIKAELTWSDTGSYGEQLGENLDDIEHAGSRVVLSVVWSF